MASLHEPKDLPHGVLRLRGIRGEWVEVFSFGAEGFGGGETGGAPCGWKRGDETGNHHPADNSQEGREWSVPVDGPSEESAIDDLHQDEGNSKTGDESEENPGGAEIGRLGHDRPKNLSPGSARGTKDSDFAGALDSEGGEGESDAEGGDRNGQCAEESGDSKRAIEDPESFVPKSGL